MPAAWHSWTLSAKGADGNLSNEVNSYDYEGIQ